MIDLEKLKQEFLVDGDLTGESLARLVRQLLSFCVVDKSGRVEFTKEGLSGKQQVVIVLTARLCAHGFDQAITDEVDVDAISQFTGLPKNQAAARAKEAWDEGLADRTARGSYRARRRNVELFMKELISAMEAKNGTK